MNDKAENGLSFAKMQALGDDYIFIDESAKRIADAPELARFLCDRRIGIGGNALALVGKSGEADFRLRLFSPDGEESRLCGNAARCAGKYLYESGFTDSTGLSLETPSGIRRLRLFTRGGKVSGTRVDMGRPFFDPAAMPMSLGSLRMGPLHMSRDSFIDQEVVSGSGHFQGTALFLCDSHLVLTVPDVNGLDMEKLGPLLERHPLFPKGVNVTFAQVLESDLIRIRAWRGTGEAPFCGDCACAALVACAQSGLSGRSAIVEPGAGDLPGELAVEWADDQEVRLSGGAEFVFFGRYPLGDWAGKVVP